MVSATEAERNRAIFGLNEKPRLTAGSVLRPGNYLGDLVLSQ